MKKINLYILPLLLIFAAPAANSVEVFSVKNKQGNHGLYLNGDIHFGGFISAISDDSEKSKDIFSVRSKGEIDFLWKGQLGKNTKYGFKGEIGFEDQIEPDEYYVYIKNKNYGSLYLGQTKSPASKRHVRAPEFYFGNLNAIEGQDFKPINRFGKIPENIDDAPRNFNAKDETDIDYDEDFQKIIYYTPRIFGVELGVSYASDITNDGSNDFDDARKGLIDEGGRQKNAVSLNVNYSNRFDNLDIAASLGFLTSKGYKGNCAFMVVGANPAPSDPINSTSCTANRNNLLAWNIGANVGMNSGKNRLSIGGGYLFSDEARSNDTQEKVIIVGTSYEINDWKFGVHYRYSNEELKAKTIESRNTTRATLGANNYEKTVNELEFGGSYAFNENFGISSGIELSNSEVESGGTKTDSKGIAFNTVLSLKF